uniref:Agrin-like n=1 Tax=Mesocestoides corti TaxID=53468 RepID=A0A5K3FS05_MESCO
MSTRSHRSQLSPSTKFEPLQAFLLKNTTVYAYPRQRRRRRNPAEDVDSVKAICQRLLYFVVFYSVLGLFFVGYLNWYMYFQVPRDHPALTGMQSALQMNPGLSYVPNSDIFSSLLYFRSREPLPYYKKSDEMAAFLHAYQDNTGSTESEDCPQEGGYKQNPERPCTYDLNAGGPCNIMNGCGI